MKPHWDKYDTLEKENLKAMKIRKFAAEHDHIVVGKLTRVPKLEYEEREDGTKVRASSRAYLDEAGNEYYMSKRGMCIVTVDGTVI